VELARITAEDAKRRLDRHDVGYDETADGKIPEPKLDDVRTSNSAGGSRFLT
jgi:hypothetical protein